MESDTTIRENVIDELDFEPAVTASGIGVAVKNGVVTLSGHVASYAEKHAATRAVQRVRGVRALAQELEVRLPVDAKRADDEIAQRALSILAWSSGRTDKVRVLVDQGWVTLSGEVPQHFLKNAAEQSVRQLSGVVNVLNNIEVKQSIEPRFIAESIRKAFERNADLESAGIKVQVDGSKVTLSGKVKAWHERRVAENAAWAVPGVTSVQDNLTL